MPLILRIGSQIGPADPFWVQVREAIQQKALQLGVDLIPIEITDRPESLSPEEQASLLDELMAEELDALICWNLPDNLILSVLDNGLPVVNSSETELRHALFVSPRGLHDAAHMGGKYLAEALAGAGQLVCVGGLMEAGGENGTTRLAGIREAVQDYTAITIIHIPSSWRSEQAAPQIEAALGRCSGPIDAIFGLSDSLALLARDRGRTLGLTHERTLVAGINGDPLALAAIAEGAMSATVETPAADFGGQMVELACQAAQRQPLPAHFSYQPRLVTRENVAEVAMQRLIAIADLPTRLVGVSRQQEQNRLTQLETSAGINRRVGALLDRRQLSQEIANLIRAQYGYDQVQLFLWSEQDACLVLDQPEAPVSVALEEAGLLREALERNEPIFIPDTHHSHRFPTDPNWPQTRSRMVIPIRLGEKILGLLDLHSRRPVVHLRQDLIGLQSLADQLGIAMRNAELYSDAIQARAAAEKADALKTRLLANVSHELRTPLNVILGYSQTALSTPNPYQIELPQRLRADLEQIYRGGEHLIRLINDLLDLSRAEIGALDLFPETIATRSFLEEVFRSLSDRSETPQVAWRLCLPERLPVIEADPVRLRQILLNLLSNARKFTPRGHITLGAEVAPPHLHVWVEDSGVGVPAELQERIFEPFMTAGGGPQRREGIGLGLTITRRLVALHNGSMTLDSHVDRGSTLHVYLPLPNLSGQPLIASAGTQPALLWLSAQDHPPEAIAELGHRLGLALVRLRPSDDLSVALRAVQPAVLAWEPGPADAGEWQLVERLRTHPQLCRLPFVFYAQADGQPAGLRAGLTDVLMKPVGHQSLADTLRALRPPAGGGSVLIVDDDPQARALHERLVAQALPGFSVYLAPGGQAALDFLAQETPSLVVLDLMMPGVDGFAVLERLRARPATRLVPVLVLSGKLLSFEDVQRLDYSVVAFQSKHSLSTDEALASLQRSLRGQPALPQPTSTLVKQVLAYLHQNYARSFTRQEISTTLGVSKNYLSEIFRQEMGLSPWECLNRLRVQRATELLRDSGASVTEIAAQVGFEDPAYFSRVFRKLVGQSPQAYRRTP